MISGRGPGAGDVIGEHLRLFPQRRDQPVHLSAMLGALAHHVDVAIVDRSHLIVDDERALDGQTGSRGDVAIGLDAGGDHHHVALERRTIGKAQPLDGRVAEQRGRVLPEQDLQAEPFHPLAEDGTRRAVELLLHQVAREMDDRYLQAEVLQTARGLETEEPAADDRRALPAAGVRRDVAAVAQRTEHEHPAHERAVRGTQAFNRRKKRTAAGRDDQLVVGLGLAVFVDDVPGLAQDAGNTPAGTKANPLLGVPRKRVQEDLVFTCGAVQHVREQDAVVVAGRLVAVHRDLELLAAAARQDLLDRACPRHPVADDGEPLTCAHHDTSMKPISSTTETATPLGAATSTSSSVSGGRSSSTASATCIASLAPTGK